MYARKTPNENVESNDYNVEGCDDDHDDEDILSRVSDTEALLACRAYLQRKKRLGKWTESESRKRKREDEYTDTVARGFFFPDVTKLKYYDPVRHRSTRDSPYYSLDDSARNVPPTKDGDGDSDGDEEDRVPASSSSSSSWWLEKIDEQRLDARRRRQETAARIWSDPEWKAWWYERRWPDKVNTTRDERNEEKKRERAERRLLDFGPEELLARPELAAMNETEIAHAIRTYSPSYRKRVGRRWETFRKLREAVRRSQPIGQGQQHEKDTTTTNGGEDDGDHHPSASASSSVLDRNDILTRASEEWKKGRQRRSEKSRAAYRARARKKVSTAERQQQPPRRGGAAAVPASSAEPTPRVALSRIEAALDAGRFSTVDDCRLVLRPSKLSRRKDVLRRVLLDCFGLRGKCIPSDLDFRNRNENAKDFGDNTAPKKHQPEKLRFVTQCTYSEIGEFVVHKLRESEKTGAETHQGAEDK